MQCIRRTRCGLWDAGLRHADRGAQTSGRQRLNIHGAIDLETGHTRMLEGGDG